MNRIIAKEIKYDEELEDCLIRIAQLNELNIDFVNGTISKSKVTKNYVLKYVSTKIDIKVKGLNIIYIHPFDLIYVVNNVYFVYFLHFIGEYKFKHGNNDFDSMMEYVANTIFKVNIDKFNKVLLAQKIKCL